MAEKDDKIRELEQLITTLKTHTETTTVITNPSEDSNKFIEELAEKDDKIKELNQLIVVLRTKDVENSSYGVEIKRLQEYIVNLKKLIPKTKVEPDVEIV